MIIRRVLFAIYAFVCALLAQIAVAQPYGEPDRGAPGDGMIQTYLRQETEKLSARFADDVKSLDAWQAKRPQYLEEYFYMLGLSPRPEKTPLEATVTGTHQGRWLRRRRCCTIRAGRSCT